MKKFQKGLMALIATVTCVSMVGMTACSNGDESGDNTNLTQEQYIDKFVDAVAEQDFAGLSGTVVVEMDQTSDATYSMSEYFSAQNYYSIGKVNINASVVYDAVNTKADLSVKYTDKSTSYYGDDYANRGKGLSGVESKTNYYGIFLRDGYAFETDSTSEITKYDSTILLDAIELSDLYGDAFGSISSQMSFLSALTDTSSLTDLDKTAISSLMSTMTEIAEKYEAVTVSGNTITVDYNKLVVGVYNDFTTILSSITGTTTVGEIVGNETVKGLIDSITSSMDAKTIYDSIKEEYGTSTEAQEIFNKLPEPAANQSVYDYLVVLINNSQFTSLVLGTNGKVLANMTLDGLLELTGTTMTVDTIKQMISSAFTLTEEGDTVTIKVTTTSGVSNITLKDYKYTVELNDNFGINKVVYSGNIGINANNTNAYSTYKTTTSVTMSVELTTLTTQTLPDFTDISNCKVTYHSEEYTSVTAFLNAQKTANA
jgi:hypothetical protein